MRAYARARTLPRTCNYANTHPIVYQASRLPRSHPPQPPCTPLLLRNQLQQACEEGVDRLPICCVGDAAHGFQSWVALGNGEGRPALARGAHPLNGWLPRFLACSFARVIIRMLQHTLAEAPIISSRTRFPLTSTRPHTNSHTFNRVHEHSAQIRTHDLSARP